MIGNHHVLISRPHGKTSGRSHILSKPANILIDKVSGISHGRSSSPKCDTGLAALALLGVGPRFRRISVLLECTKPRLPRRFCSGLLHSLNIYRLELCVLKLRCYGAYMNFSQGRSQKVLDIPSSYISAAQLLEQGGSELATIIEQAGAS